MTTATINSKINKYTTNVEKIEEFVKIWEEDFKVKTISISMQKLFVVFNDTQMSISEISDSELRGKSELNCYKATYDFLCFVENDVDSDFYIYITNKVAEFSKVIRRFSQYCTKIEKKHNIELHSENFFGVTSNLPRKKTAAKRK